MLPDSDGERPRPPTAAMRRGAACRFALRCALSFDDAVPPVATPHRERPIAGARGLLLLLLLMVLCTLSLPIASGDAFSSWGDCVPPAAELLRFGLPRTSAASLRALLGPLLGLETAPAVMLPLCVAAAAAAAARCGGDSMAARVGDAGDDTRSIAWPTYPTSTPLPGAPIDERADSDGDMSPPGCPDPGSVLCMPMRPPRIVIDPDWSLCCSPRADAGAQGPPIDAEPGLGASLPGVAPPGQSIIASARSTAAPPARCSFGVLGAANVLDWGGPVEAGAAGMYVAAVFALRGCPVTPHAGVDLGLRCDMLCGRAAPCRL